MKLAGNVRPASYSNSILTNCDLAGHTAVLDNVSRITSRHSEAGEKGVYPVPRKSWAPKLKFKKVHRKEPIYSVRVTCGYRALGLLESNEIAWFWIGDHTRYERLISELAD